MQPELFPEVTAARQRDWIADLLASATYAAQKRLAGRGAPKDEDVRRLLAALETGGGRLSQTALAQALGVPAFRVVTVVNAARRGLNVDQTPVLWLEPGQADLNVLSDRTRRLVPSRLAVEQGPARGSPTADVAARLLSGAGNG